MRTLTLLPPTDAAVQILEAHTWTEIVLISYSAANVAVGTDASVTPANGQGMLLPMDQPVRLRLPPKSRLYIIADTANQRVSVAITEMCAWAE